MSLQGPIVVVADKPAPDLVQALGAAGAFPIVERRWVDAPSAFISGQLSAIVLAEPGPASDAKAADTLALQIQSSSGPFIPLIGRARSDAGIATPGGLPIDADASTSRLVARLGMALRIRALHAAVLRRVETFSSQDGTLPTLPQTDPAKPSGATLPAPCSRQPSAASASRLHDSLSVRCWSAAPAWMPRGSSAGSCETLTSPAKGLMDLSFASLPEPICAPPM